MLTNQPAIPENSDASLITKKPALAPFCCLLSQVFVATSRWKQPMAANLLGWQIASMKTCLRRKQLRLILWQGSLLNWSCWRGPLSLILCFELKTNTFQIRELYPRAENSIASAYVASQASLYSHDPFCNVEHCIERNRLKIWTVMKRVRHVNSRESKTTLKYSGRK